MQTEKVKRKFKPKSKNDDIMSIEEKLNRVRIIAHRLLAQGHTGLTCHDELVKKNNAILRQRLEEAHRLSWGHV